MGRAMNRRSALGAMLAAVVAPRALESGPVAPAAPSEDLVTWGLWTDHPRIEGARLVATTSTPGPILGYPVVTTPHARPGTVYVIDRIQRKALTDFLDAVRPIYELYPSIDDDE
jgi:hypothetical protein